MRDKTSDRLAHALSRFAQDSIKRSIFLSFTVSAMLAVILTGMIFYLRFSAQLDTSAEGENETLVEAVTQNVNVYLRNMMKLSDSLYYDVIKDADLSAPGAVNDQLQLLYTANSAYVQNIVLFSRSGEVLATAPPAMLREGAKVTSAAWFQSALAGAENLHFSTPALENLFVDADNQYSWVLSLSSSAGINFGKDVEQGVLLIDLKYSGLSEFFRNQELSNGGYVYLTDADGALIYHPQQQLIVTGLAAENNAAAAQLRDGSYTEKFGGITRTVIVRSVGYTGWKVVGVIPHAGLTFETQANIVFVLLFFFVLFELLTIINAIISARLTDPLHKLDQSVQKMEQGLSNKIYMKGSYEVRHLGRSIQSMVDQMRRLNDQIVLEHELKQKSELNALQAQINPHFLYNTLDVIVWMIENERPDAAVKLVTALARLFRISLAKGRNIVTLREELEHARSYLTIQLMRYKDKFTYSIDVPEKMMDMSIIKLVIQPIVENAIYHSMDYMDGDGHIRISGRLENGEMWVSVQDNGMGIRPDVVERLLSDYVVTGSSGSGIGLKNVNERIHLYFGEAYGVRIESELDVGTTITLHLPAIPYGQMEEDK